MDTGRLPAAGPPWFGPGPVLQSAPRKGSTVKKILLLLVVVGVIALIAKQVMQSEH